MGSRGDSGASGSDAGFENTQKSKLSKRNQKKVDTAFNERGKLKIDENVGKLKLHWLLLLEFYLVL